MILRMLAVLLFASFLCTRAHAQKVTVEADAGRVPLATVLELARPNPNLRQEVKLALITAQSDKSRVTCTSNKLGVAWGALALRAIGPYRCAIGNRVLTLKTQPVFYDAAGHKFTQSDTARASKAARLKETRLVWVWQ